MRELLSLPSFAAVERADKRERNEGTLNSYLGGNFPRKVTSERAFLLTTFRAALALSIEFAPGIDFDKLTHSHSSRKRTAVVKLLLLMSGARRARRRSALCAPWGLSDVEMTCWLPLNL